MAIAVTGIGVACGLGYGKTAFRKGLLDAPNLFSVLKREGREAADGEIPFIGVELLDLPETLPPRLARTASFPARVALTVLEEAWSDAGLDGIDPDRIGLVVGGTNLMAREQALAARSYADRLAYVPPRHGHMFLDTDIGGLCASRFPIRGFCQTVGAASASGSVAIIEAMSAIRSGRVDVCIALGALQDLSAHDLHAMRSLGAMGSARFSEEPGRACRPMDADHDGFIYGEASAALVLTRSEWAGAGKIYGTLLGAGHVADGTRGPEPNSAGQVRAAELALREAGLAAADIDYVNGHATSTSAGDIAELETWRALDLAHARINATKSIFGHGLSAAGAIETTAVLIQMQAGHLHPTRNLDNPLDAGLNWVGPGAGAVLHDIRHALKFSFGFGGIDTALVIAAPDIERRAE
ncbi:beta-ketoacyl synthase N-terminal-like domain-containing protein [Breoghania sp.]|uniref:beta-ketoacyl synthase N-terminal-like domain-containing protein n=1 Tax=Breoghania sp. TaxID=2065378 RepID=UPI00261A20BD|nr:beta-ketoacyl synthase N-terminal-like domain-containing protein [Breoghania sp.]MDJ0933261.1 beta-ketoacyl synthase N-terminal-like domain-containing protein [Breoghania sp.]